MRAFVVFGALLSILALSACDRFGATEKGALGGAAAGAGLGAVVGHKTGNTGAGVAIGAGSGALVGGVIGSSTEQQDRNQAEQDEMLRRQEMELERQRREIEDLKRQKYHDDNYRDRYEGGEDRTYDDQDSFRR